jgi:hypothetical protein
VATLNTAILRQWKILSILNFSFVSSFGTHDIKFYVFPVFTSRGGFLTKKKSTIAGSNGIRN